MDLIEIRDQVLEKPDGFAIKSPYLPLSASGKWDSRLILLFGMDWSGTCIAGGFPFNLACKRSPPHDMDFFFYQDHEYNLHRVAKFLLDKINRDGETYGSAVIESSQNVLRIRTTYGMSFDFICIRYPSIRAILESFDLDCCRFAYNGRAILATESGLAVFRTMSMSIDLSRATTSLCRRIVKYYQRGVGIRIQNPEIERAIRAGQSFMTPELVFQFHSVSHSEHFRASYGISHMVMPGYTIQCIVKIDKQEYDSGFEQQSSFPQMKWKDYSPDVALFNPVKIAEKEFWAMQPIKWTGNYYSE